jgi:hypothetical protein
VLTYVNDEAKVAVEDDRARFARRSRVPSSVPVSALRRFTYRTELSRAPTSPRLPILPPAVYVLETSWERRRWSNVGPTPERQSAADVGGSATRTASVSFETRNSRNLQSPRVDYAVSRSTLLDTTRVLSFFLKEKETQKYSVFPPFFSFLTDFT